MGCNRSGFPVLHQLPGLAQNHVHPVSDAIQPSHPLWSPSPPAFNPSHHQHFSNESVLHIRWPKYWNCSFNISTSNEFSGLISFRIDWLDLLVVQGTLKSLLQHQSSKASVLQCSAYFIIQLSHLYMTTWKTIALTRRTFVSKVMSLLFNMLSRLVTVSPSICHEVMGLGTWDIASWDAMILVFWMLSFKPTCSLSSYTFIKRLFSSSSLSAIRVVSSAYLRLLIFLLAILIPACASSGLAFHMVYSA